MFMWCYVCAAKRSFHLRQHPGTGKMLWQCMTCGAWTSTLDHPANEADPGAVITLDSRGTVLDTDAIMQQRKSVVQGVAIVSTLLSLIG